MKTRTWVVLIVGGYLAYSLWWKGAIALAKTVAANGGIVPNGKPNGVVAPNGKPNGAVAATGNGVKLTNGRALDVRAPNGAPTGLLRALSPTTASNGGCPDCRCPGCP